MAVQQTEKTLISRACEGFVFVSKCVAILRGHAMTKRSSSVGGFLGGDDLLRFLRLTDAPVKKL